MPKSARRSLLDTPSKISRPSKRPAPHKTSPASSVFESPTHDLDSSHKSGNVLGDRSSDGRGNNNDDDDWWIINDILKERGKGRHRHYLVDWANHPATGETYPPSWIPARQANPEAVRAWNAIKRQNARVARAAYARSTTSTTAGSRTPDSDLGSRKRSITTSDEDPVDARARKRLRPAHPSSHPYLLSAQAPSRAVSTESPEFEPAPSGAVLEDLIVNINHGSDFDPDEYLRLSQLQSQSQSQSQSQRPSESQPWDPSPSSVHHPAARQPSQKAQPQISPRTIPDSEGDSAGLPSTLTESNESQQRQQQQQQTAPSTLLALADTPSHQPGQNRADESAAQASQLGQQLRESQDWASEPAPVPGRSQPGLPWESTTQKVNPKSPEHASLEDSSARHSSGIGHGSLHFQTQPLVFDLLSQPLESQASTAQTLSQQQRPTQSPSVIADSTRPDRTSHLHSAQIEPPLVTQDLGIASQSQDSQISPAFPPRPDRHLRQDGQRGSAQDSVSASLPWPSTPSQSRSGAMANTPKSAVDQLKEAIREGMGVGGLLKPDNPAVLAEIARLQKIEEAKEKAHKEQIASAERISAAEPEGPATLDTALGPDAPMTDAGLDNGANGLGPQDDEPSLPAAESSGEPRTIAPSALSLGGPVVASPPSSEAAAEGLAQLEGQQGHSSPVGTSPSGQSHASVGQAAEGRSSPVGAQIPYVHDYIVTLPLAANSRQRYIDVVMDKENQATIKAFGQVFARDVTEQPSAQLVARIDEVLQKLLDLADAPPFYDSLPTLSTEATMKYAANTNSKFSFVFEFLQAIASTGKTVLILAQGDTLLDYLQAMVAGIDLPVQRWQGAGTESKHDSHGRTSVLLSDTQTSAADGLPPDVDYVIGFDHTARLSGLLEHYMELAERTGARAANGLPKPMVLLLVAAYTLEHVDMRLALRTIDEVERKNALLLCTLECLAYMQDTAQEDVPAKPHEAAEAFAKFFADPTQELAWKPAHLPDDVFDIYISSSDAVNPVLSQEESALLSNVVGEGVRKRQRDGDEHGDAKRARFEAPTIVTKRPAHVTAVVKAALGGPVLTSGPTVEISAPQLQALAVQATSATEQLRDKTAIETRLEAQVRSLDSLAQDRAATVRQCQRKLLAAVQDRGVFEVERDKATKEAAAAQEKLAARDSALAALKEENAKLAAELAEARTLLAGSTTQPEAARLATALAAEEAAHARVAVLERKVTNAETDLAHARRAYQDASNAAADLSSENRDLAARVQELDRLAATNLRHIHEMHQRSEAAAARRQWEAQQVVLHECERELEWTREELRVLKSGRRETRAQSVPRSPRLSMMSPRTVAAAAAAAAARGSSHGHGGHGHGERSGHSSGSSVAGGGGATLTISRGNSPIAANADNGGAGLAYHGTGGVSNLAPVPGMTYFTPQQGGSRWGHLRD